MFQTPWMKGLGTALFSDVSKEKPRGGKATDSQLGEALSACPKIE
jgi:hypothetical protein